MSRVRNADDFLFESRRIRGEYEERFGPQIAAVRAKYADNPVGTTPDAIQAQLEYHARCYLINGLLEALNWRLNTPREEGLPPLVPEAPVRSSEYQTVKFLDYLGLEQQTLRPLLIVETKRPTAPLPRLANPVAGSPEEGPSAALRRGLAGASLVGGWTDWLDTIRDYVRSVHKKSGYAPERVVVTNGEWMVVFLAPDDAFLGSKSVDAGEILVYRDWDEIDGRHAEVFLQLEHARVAGHRPALRAGEVAFQIAGEYVDRAMHGVRVTYAEKPGNYDRWPTISVAPLVHLRSRFGMWFQVEDPGHDYFVPDAEDALPGHLADVKVAASTLLSEVSASLGKSLVPTPLADHYRSDDFNSLRGFVEGEPGRFVLATGEATHYLRSEPTVPDCPFHSWMSCDADGVAANPGPLRVASIKPRAFFPTDRLQHCAHQQVIDRKASPITEANAERCGPRSGNPGNAFCEIWRFETHLCCRTCAFEDVCTAAEVFRLPCQRPSNDSPS